MPKEKQPGKPRKCVELLENMLDCVGSPVFAKDASFRFVYLNKAAEDFLGHPNSEMLGKTDDEFFPAEQARIFREHDRKVFRQRREDINEEFVTDASGHKHSIVTRKRVFTDGGGGDILVGVINDVTALKKANGELAMFRRLLDNSNDAIFIVDPDTGAFLDFNETACRRLGYQRQTLLRMGVPDVQEAAEGLAGWEQLKSMIVSSDSLLVKGRHRRMDGTYFPVEVSIGRAIVDGKGYLLASARDITERLKMEEAMQEVDTLRGLIPICAKCKNIRDDKGFWHNVEAYLEKHSGAKFTHGLCKECMMELYGKESWFRDDEEKS